nr:L-rhamnose mutarotase [uncultured Allomuricauda sp.]
MKRLAFKMKLNVAQKKAYVERHNQLWPELESLLKESGVSEYSIFLDEETHILFAFQKVTGKGGSQDLAHSKIVQKWWAYMSEIMETNTDNSPIAKTLVEVFFME